MPSKTPSSSARGTGRSTLDRVRKVCLALPEAHEVEAWGAPTFRVKNKLFAMYSASGSNHGDGRASLWVKSTHTNQDLLLRSDPNLFFFPAYVGKSGWIGIYLDRRPDWKTITEIIHDAWQLTAPKKLAATLDRRTDRA